MIAVAQFAAIIACFLRARARVLPHAAAPTTTREAALSSRDQTWILDLLLAGPYLIIAIAALMMRAHWDQIPASMPVHWDFAGNPNGWMPKTPAVLVEFFGTVVIASLMVTFVIAGMIHWSRRINAIGPRARAESRFRWIGLALLLGSGYFIAAMAFIPLGPRPSLTLGIAGAFMVAALVATFEIIRAGQGGAGLVPDAGQPNPTGDRTPDQCWKWGIIYYNPDDPALMVEKRFGIGWTVNFAHRGAWVFMSLLGLYVLYVVYTVARPFVMPHS